MSKFHFFCLMIMAACALLGPGAAHAQKALPDMSAAAQGDGIPPIPDNAKIPDQYLDESMAVAAECKRNIFAHQYFNCDCRGAKFLALRYARGPAANKSVLVSELKDVCRDATEAAGTIYNDCVGGASSAEQEKICACKANTYAKLMDRVKPEINPSMLAEFKKRATMICTNPEMAARSGYVVPPR